MWMEVTEEEAAIIKRLARSKHHELSMMPGAYYPGPSMMSEKDFLAGVEAEKNKLQAIAEKSNLVAYFVSVQRTAGAEAMTPEAASWIRNTMAQLRDARGDTFFRGLRLVSDILTPLGLSILPNADSTEYGVTCPPATKRSKR